MIWWPLIFIGLAFASEDMTFEKYCFSSSSRMEQTLSKLKVILVPSDKVEADPPCLTVSMRPHRRELIQAYVRNLAPDVSISFSEAEIKRPPCHLKVEKIKQIKKESLNIDVSEKQANATNSQTELESKENFQIQTTKEFELMVDQEAIKGSCRFINANRYDLALEVRKDPKPVYPGVRPPDQETAILKTELQINRGERIEIGSIIKDLKDKNRQVDISPELKQQNAEGQAAEKIFLQID